MCMSRLHQVKRTIERGVRDIARIVGFSERVPQPVIKGPLSVETDAAVY